MSAFREPGFKERQEAAAKAKQAALDKLRARQKPVEPAVVQQQPDRATRAKERSATKGARATEKAEKQAAKTEKQATGKAAPKAARKARGK